MIEQHTRLPRHLMILCLAGIVVIYALLRIHLLDIPLERDEGTFGYFGQAINAGQLPYRDVVDNKPPVTFYLYALALHWVEPTARGVHLFAHAYNLLTLFVLVVTARRFFRSDLAALWTGASYAVFTSAPSVEGFAATTELFMLLPLALSVLAAVVAAERREWIWIALCGACGMLACWTKQTAVFSVVVPAAYILVALWLRETGTARERLRAVGLGLGALASGALAVSLLVLAPFVAGGSVADFVYWVFQHGIAYVGQSAGIGHNMGRVAGWIWRGLPGDTLLLLLGFVLPWFFLARGRRQTLFVTAFLALSLLGMLPGFQYRHYFLQLGPAVALATGWSFYWLFSGRNANPRRAAVAYALGVALVCAPLLTNTGYYVWTSTTAISRQFFTINPFPESVPLADYLRSHSNPDDRVLVFGSEPQVLFLAERKSAIKFVPVYPLFGNFPRQREFQDTAWEEIRATRPRFIVLTNVMGSFAPSPQASPWFQQKVMQLLDAKYRLVAWTPLDGGEPRLRSNPGNGSPLAELARHPGFLALAERVRD